MSEDDAARERPAPPSRERAMIAVPLASGAVALFVYASTAARTITWWDGSSYPLAAATLGIPGAPGSLMLTLLGWLVCQVPLVHPIAFRLNLLAALIVAALVGLVTWLAIRLATPERRGASPRELFAGALAGLTFAFGVTPWTYAVQFTPYGLSALFTGLILVTALAWWRRPEGAGGRPQLFLLFLLFGLDLSVHRTNSLLLPAAILWLALRHPGGPGRPGDWAAAVAGLAVGLCFHLLLIPLAARRPSYLVEDPSDLAGLWRYVSLDMKGGAFLVGLFPRKADFLGFQIADYLAFLGRNLSPPLFLPAILAACGWLATLRGHPRRALGWLAFFLCAGLGAVVYFNLPRGYMRTMDRHYLPSLVILAPWVGVGAGALLGLAGRPRAGNWLAPALALVLSVIPVAALATNRRACDLSRARFAEGFARDLLEPLPERAILLTNGDNDTLPLWYLQQVEGVRTDVTVINLPLANTAEYVVGLRSRNADLARLLEGEPERGVLQPVTVGDTAIATVVEPRADLGLPASVEPPDSVTFRPSGMLLGQDRVVLDLLQLTRWRRPVFIAVTVSGDQLGWIRPYARLDGLAWRVIPTDDPAVWDVEHLREQLFTRVRYEGFADRAIIMDATTQALGGSYAGSLLRLATAQLQRGQGREALATLRFLDQRVPLARLGVATGPIGELRAQIEADARRTSPAD